MAAQYLYLHGFASSPQSRKATFFAERLQEAGIHLQVPDLEQGDFAHLTVRKQFQLAGECIGSQETVLIGSSLGGYLASLLARQHPQVQKLMLLAPAFEFAELWAAELGAVRLAHWKESGWLEFFHYRQGEQERLWWEFIEDARRFPLFPSFSQPALIFHGDRDTVVPVERSERFQRSHPNVELRILPSGHELTDVLDPIWQQSKEFLLRPGPEIRC